MRADRLLSMLILLQERGRMTANELALELEVSERTIYRDIVALSTAGVPVYAESGPGGGCSLVDSYRTNLTGLTRDEVRALFMLSVPSPLAELGVDQDLKAALLKLSAALPDIFKPEGSRVRQRIHLDSTTWFHQATLPALMHTIQSALWADRRLNLTYHLPFDAQVQHLVEPLGLVSKASAWYLVFSHQGDIFVLKMGNVIDCALSQETFEYPPGFDLVKFWTDWCQEYEANRPHFEAKVLMARDMVKMLQLFKDPLVSDLDEAASQQVNGWYTFTLHFETFEKARQRLLNFGGAVEVLAPLALRSSIQDFAAQIQSVYQR